MTTMKRQPIGDGRWFNLETAQKFEEDTYWDGHNHISTATGSQWDHQTLYRTKSGKWILHSYSQWQGSRDKWEVIDNEAAAKWLVQNNESPHPAVESEYAALEI